jgi:hypothetical protein
MSKWRCNYCGFTTTVLDAARDHVRGDFKHICWSADGRWAWPKPEGPCRRGNGRWTWPKPSREVAVDRPDPRRVRLIERRAA